MKDSFASTWILGLVAGFIFIFSAYIAITISYSSAFKTKNEMLSIIEKGKGVTTKKPQKVNSIIESGKQVWGKAGSLYVMNAYISGSGYHTKGYCNDGTSAKWVGVKNIDPLASSGVYDNPAKANTKYYYCFSKWSNNGRKSTISVNYYKLKLFYKFDLPVIGDLYVFNIDGETNYIYNIQDSSAGWTVNS